MVCAKAVVLAALSLTLVHTAIAADVGVRPKVLEIEFSNSMWGFYAHVQLRGNTLLYSNSWRKIHAKLSPTVQEWRTFRRALDDIGIWDWQDNYRRGGTDQKGWLLHVEYSDRILKAGGGRAPSLKLLNRSVFALQKLIGGRPVDRHLVGELELFDLAELQLVATHPASEREKQWAEFRDPYGKVRRVYYAGIVGANFGVVQEVRSDSVLLKELAGDADTECCGRDTVVNKSRAP